MTGWPFPRNIAASRTAIGRIERRRPHQDIKREETMMRRLVLAGAVLLIGTCGAVQAQQTPKVYNTAKQKLLDGKQVVGGTVFSPDPAMYCAMANAGFDFLWIEMQHSPLTYQEVARMIFACRGSAGRAVIRVSHATRSDVQKGSDIGATGVIVPTLANLEKAEAAVRW